MKPLGAEANAITAAMAARILGLFMSIPPTRLAPTVLALGRLSNVPLLVHGPSTHRTTFRNRSSMLAKRDIIRGNLSTTRPQRSSLVS